MPANAMSGLSKLILVTQQGGCSETTDLGLPRADWIAKTLLAAAPQMP
jgi:hypothetical protein